MNAPTSIHPDRSLFLGGSDAAAVMGLSPWATPVELWEQKTGRKPKATPTAAQQKVYDRGHHLEPFIRGMVMDKLRANGLEVALLAANERYVDPEYGFLSCEIDFELVLTGDVVIGDEVVTLNREHVNGDAKSVTGFARKKWGEDDTEDVPIEYAAQFMHGLMVTGRNLCLVAALKSFDDVDIYWVRRDEETIAGMRPKLVSFWVDHVLAGVPPDPIEFDDIKALFPNDNGQAVDATVEIASKVRDLVEIKKRIKGLEEDAKQLQFAIAEYISPNAILKYDGKEIATWKGQGHTALDQAALKAAHPDIAAKFTKTSTVRVLRLKKGA
jgi:predicted phage-related endonuclease